MNKHHHEYGYATNKARGVFAGLLRGRLATSDMRQQLTYGMTLCLMVAPLLAKVGDARETIKKRGKSVR